MRKTIIVSSALLVAGLTTVSFGANVEHAGIKAGPYIGANVGIGGMVTKKFSSDTKSSVSSYSERIGGLTGRLFMGYFWQLPQLKSLKLGPEVGYEFYPDNKYKLNDSEWKYSGFNIDLLGVAHYNIASTGWNIFGKAGLAYIAQKVRISFTGDKSRTKFLPKLIAGVGYDFTEHFGMNLAVSHVFGSEPSRIENTSSTHGLDKVASVNTLTAGLSYHF